MYFRPDQIDQDQVWYMIVTLHVIYVMCCWQGDQMYLIECNCLAFFAPVPTTHKLKQCPTFDWVILWKVKQHFDRLSTSFSLSLSVSFAAKEAESVKRRLKACWNSVLHLWQQNRQRCHHQRCVSPQSKCAASSLILCATMIVKKYLKTGQETRFNFRRIQLKLPVYQRNKNAATPKTGKPFTTGWGQ